MKCQACQDLLQQPLDGQALPGAAQAELEKHLHACPECWALQAGLRRLGAGLRLLAPPAPPAHLAQQIVAQVRRQQRQRLRVRWLAGAALAAGLLLVVLLWRPWQAGVPDGGGKSGTMAEVKPVPEQPVVPAVNLRQTMEEAGSVMASLTSQTADATMDQTRLFLPLVPGPTLSSLDIPQPATLSLGDAGRGVSAGLEPVTSSARRAVDLFFRDLPPMTLSEKPGL